MEKILHFNDDDIQHMESRYRANFINSVTGYKSANLLGTISEQGIENLAVFSSITHLGSSPAMLGFITRPTTVPRHTYTNLKATGVFTVNHINASLVKPAHQTAARYDMDISEFEAVGLTAQYDTNFKAPFVKEAHIKIACEYINEYAIVENGTLLVVAAIKEIILPETAVSTDGWINLETVQGVTINGLDSYSLPRLVDRLAYAKPNEEVQSMLGK